MSIIPHLANLSNISRLGNGKASNKKAYLFDGVNDYIAGDTTIGRTGYDMNISGNVSTGSDSDGSYIYFNGNRLGTAATGTRAQASITGGPTMNQGTSFTLKARFKFSAFAPVAVSGIFAGNFDGGLQLTTTALTYGLRGSSLVINTTAVNINTLYDAYLVYDASVTKFYLYLGTSGGASTLINVGGTSGPATFSFTDITLGDNAIINSDADSCPKNIYHAAIRNVALSQAEIDADIALGNTAKTDPRIVAYYIPENLQYNTQYMTNPKDLTNATWTKGANTTITGDYATAPDGTMTADRVVRTGVGGLSANKIERTFTTLSGSLLASKTFIVKAFVRAVTTTKTFRLRCSHSGVADYYSSDQTATSVRQEFTFTQTFTSSSSGTGITGGLVSDTGVAATDLEVRNVRVFVTNETLRDESPNIGGYIGRKTQKVFSCRLKPTADASGDTFNTQPFITIPWVYGYIRTTNNSLRVRYSTRPNAGNESAYTLGNGFRSKVHVELVFYWTGSARGTKLYINGALQDSDTFTIDACNASLQTTITLARYPTPTYYSGYIRDPRIYTFTGSFTNADALAIYNGLEPSSAGITKYLHWRPTPGEAGTTAIDHSGNSRTGTLTGGTTRPFLSGS